MEELCVFVTARIGLKAADLFYFTPKNLTSSRVLILYESIDSVLDKSKNVLSGMLHKKYFFFMKFLSIA